MAGHVRSSTSYAIIKALLSLSSSQSLAESSEDSLIRVGTREVVTRKMKKHSYFQWTENRFTESLMLSALSIVVPNGGLALDIAN
jgi:hypothetical protein